MTVPFCSSPFHLWTRNCLWPGQWTLSMSTFLPQSLHLGRHVQMCQCLCLPFWKAQCGFQLPLQECWSSCLTMCKCVSTIPQTSFPWNCHTFQGLQKSWKAWGLVGLCQADLMMLALLGPWLSFGWLCLTHWSVGLLQLQAEYSLCWLCPTDLY